MALLRHLAEYLDLFCLVMGMEGNVGLIPVAPDAEPLELLGHSFDVLGGKLFASPAKLNWAERFTLEFVRFDDLGFYREAVGIPAWYVGHVEAHHSFVLNDKVFHHLVVGCADVYLSVGVWRAIMKDEDRTALPPFCDPLIYSLLFPSLEYLWFLFRQTCPHRKGCMGKIQCVVVRHRIYL